MSLQQWPEDNFDEECRKDDERRDRLNGSDFTNIAFSDIALAKEFANQNAEQLRFVPLMGKWFVWDGRRWEMDVRLTARERAKATCRAEAQKCNKGKAAKLIASARKGIEFDDLKAAGMEGLVKAARVWVPKEATFQTYATRCIQGEIQHLVRDTEEFELDSQTHESADRDGEEDLLSYQLDEAFWEFRVNGVDIPQCDWKKPAFSHDEIVTAWNNLPPIGDMVGLSQRERDVVTARFLKEPKQSLASIARQHEISYYKAVKVLWTALRKLNKAPLPVSQLKNLGDDAYHKTVTAHLKNGKTQAWPCATAASSVRRIEVTSELNAEYTQSLAELKKRRTSRRPWAPTAVGPGLAQYLARYDNERNNIVKQTSKCLLKKKGVMAA